MPVSFTLEKRTDKKGDAPIRVLIFIRGKKFKTSSGFSIHPDKWNKEKQEVKQGSNNSRGITYNVINGHLNNIKGHFIAFENKCISDQLVVTFELLRSTYQKEFGKEKPIDINKENQKTFFDFFDEFTNEQGTKNNWTISTYEKFAAVKNHITKAISNPSFEFFDTLGMAEYVAYLRDTKKMRNSTLGKQLGFLKWFLRWATAKGYCINNDYQSYKPKLKTSVKKVIFLNWEELMIVYKKEIPEELIHLEKVRDVFCFCCFTSLRYSDVFNLKKSDISNGSINVTTVKTADSLVIELNKYSQAILDKYKEIPFEENKALPVISNQKMNKYLKDLGALCEIKEPTRITYYSGNKRTDQVFPKHKLLGTHAGRRTFICNALALGIPAQVVMKWTGHSDYKAMKPYIDIADKIKAESMNKFNQL
jgi:integrase